AELAANLAEETAHDLALAFQRAIVGQVELDPEDADVHGRLTLPAIINSVNITHAVELARAGREQAEKDLFEHLRTPSVSALSEHAADCRKAAGWLLQRLQRMGMDARLVEGDGHPLVFAEWLGRPGKPVLTIYGTTTCSRRIRSSSGSRRRSSRPFARAAAMLADQSTTKAN